jgi:hypothetical protein
MKKLLTTCALLVAFALTLAWSLPAQASPISIDFSASGSQLGQGRVDSSGNWVHNASRINGTTTPGDPAQGGQAGFSDFNFWDAVGFGEYPLHYGETYDFQGGFNLPYFDGEFLVWGEGADPYDPHGGAMFGGSLNLSTITMATDGMGFFLSGTLTDMWFDDSIASTVLFDIANAPSANFSMYVAANRDLVDRLNRFKGNTKTKVLSGSISIGQTLATPEPSSFFLMVSGLGLGLFWFHRQRGPAPAKRG